MWQYDSTSIESSNAVLYRLKKEEAFLSFTDFVHYLSTSDSFRTFFNQLLADAEFEAFFWECKSVTHQTADQNFEFVLVNSSTLVKIREKQQPFQKHFNTVELAVTFSNLGGDSQLIVPTPQSENCYAHLAAFVRKASKQQQQAFWQLVGESCQIYIGEQPIWWSTSGLGVYWLHVRIDRRPKYYTYLPYR